MIAFSSLRGRVMVVDDDEHIRAYVEELLTKFGYKLSAAATGLQALEAIEREPPDVVLLDVNMPGLDGFEVCRRLKSDDRTRLLPVVLVTGLHNTDDRVRGIEAGADDFITKPFSSAELMARVGSLMRLKQFTDELDSARAVIRSLALTIESRDRYTAGHCERLARYAAILGEAIGLDGPSIQALHLGGYLHDIGKIGVPDAVLLKPGRLTDEERALMEQHTVIGEALISGLRSLGRARGIVRHHHERLDGGGYPDRLAGDAIPIEAQVMSVVDAYDAMTTDRPYKAAKSPAQACAELRDEAARGWKAPHLVEVFAGLVEAGMFEGDSSHVA